MIIRQPQELDGVNYLYTYSDAGVCIRQDQTGTVYTDALDLLGTTYTYSETDIPAEIDDSEEGIYAQVGHIVLGE